MVCVRVVEVPGLCARLVPIDVVNVARIGQAFALFLRGLMDFGGLLGVFGGFSVAQTIDARHEANGCFILRANLPTLRTVLCAPD